MLKGEVFMSNLLRQIPAVHKLLSEPRIIDATEGISTAETTALIRGFLDQLREHTLATQEALDYETIVTELVKELEIYQLQRFQEVINATGVLLHTNLGRAPLPPLALERIRELGQGYFNLELNLATGERGSRYTNVAKLFNILNNPQQTTLNDTVIVNNNAAAVLVVLKALAAGHEVLVSRGQLVEIGGGFRVPEVISASGCILKEVGTTNRTRLSDYERAITPQTKAILLVHPSNYNIIGFTETVEREDLAQLAKEHGLLLIEDVGSGAFAPFPEPLVSTALQSSHIVTYSGDKLLGGPQAGIITGRQELIQRIKKEPLLRAIRIDKLSLIALEAVLELYLNKDYEQLPLWALATLEPETIKARAKHWLNQLGPNLKGEVLPTYSTMGGGSLPGETIPSWALVLESSNKTCDQLALWLRRSHPSVMGKIIQDRIWLDPRTVLPFQDQALIEILRRGC